MALWADEPIVPRRSISTRLYICTLSDVQVCASARASACGKSKQGQLLRVGEISLPVCDVGESRRRGASARSQVGASDPIS